MKLLCILLLVSNICLAQLEAKWVRKIKLDSTNANGEIFYSLFDDKVYILNVHPFFKSEMITNPDGSISMSFGVKASTDSLQKATIYEIKGDGSQQTKEDFFFHPKFKITHFAVTGNDSFLVFGAEKWITGDKKSFIKEWYGKDKFSEYSFNTDISFNLKHFFTDNNQTEIIGVQYKEYLSSPVFYSIHSKEKILQLKTPDSINLGANFHSGISNDKYYIAGYSCLNKDSTDKNKFDARLLVFDKNGLLQKDEICQLDDSIHRFDVESISTQKGETAIIGYLSYKDYMRQMNDKVVLLLKKGKILWSDTLQQNYNPQSIHHTGDNIIVVALDKKGKTRGYNNYHLLRYNNQGKLLEDYPLDDIKPEWKNLVIVHASENQFVFAGKNIFNSLVIEKMTF
jgi:hypothetical protein